MKTADDQLPASWRNRIVMRDGSSVWGLKTWLTGGEAKASADRQIRRLRDWVSQGIEFEVQTDDGDIDPREVSHVVQVMVDSD
jgi:hypothetical protein